MTLGFKIRNKLIKLLACGEPVILNCNVNSALVVEGAQVLFMPCKGARYTKDELMSKAVLTPRNAATKEASEDD